MTKKKSILIVGLILLAVIVTTYIVHTESPGSKETGTSAIQQEPEINLTVYALENGWAYKVLINNSIFIDQENIPGLTGDKVFQSKSEAEKCGQLVIKKLRQRVIPSVSKEELDSLGIRY